MTPDAKSLLAGTIDDWRRSAAPDGGKMSISDLAYEARRHGASSKLDGSALSKVLTGQRPYDAQLLAALARALGRAPNELDHYRLAVMREALDENQVGELRALEALRRIERLLAATDQTTLGLGVAPEELEAAQRTVDAEDAKAVSRRAADAGTTGSAGRPGS